MSSLEATLAPLPSTLLVGGEIARALKHALETAGAVTGVAESGADAVLAVRAGGYQAVVVSAALSDMSAYDFTLSLLRHVPGVFVVVYGAMQEDHITPLVSTGRVAHLSDEGSERVARVLAERGCAADERRAHALEQELAEVRKSHAALEAELARAQAQAQRVATERDGLMALIGSIEEERTVLEKRLAATAEIEKDKAQLEAVVREMAKRRERAGGSTAHDPVVDALKSLEPLTWGLVQAVEHLQAAPGGDEHARNLRFALRALEALFAEVRERGLLD